MPFRVGPTELIIILVIVLVVFGAGRLPEVGGALGKGIRAFRRGQSGENGHDDVDESTAKEEETSGKKEKGKAKT
jgi:sec-independent protein translocase protein TatA